MKICYFILDSGDIFNPFFEREFDLRQSPDAHAKHRVRLYYLLTLYLVYLFIFTLSPFSFSLSWLKRFLSFGFPQCIGLLFHFYFFDSVSNILLFIPLGALLFFLLKKKGTNSGRRSLIVPLCAGAVLSAGIETAQLFLDRSTSVFDVLANAGGTLLGYTVFGKWNGVGEAFQKFFRVWQKRLLRIVVALVYILAFIFLTLLPSRLNSLKDWDEKFYLLVGDEETLNRPWEGEVCWVAIYNRAFGMDEIQNVYALRMKEQGGQGSIGSAVAVYAFSEAAGDTVQDRSGWGESLPLTGEKPIGSKNGRGVTIEKGHPLRSVIPGRKITRALAETSQMTLEVVMRTSRLNQRGPARIVTLSGSTNKRNFTLAQNGRDMHFRVRTPLTGSNGSRIHLETKSILNDQNIHHVVVTFHRGVEKLAFDGQLQRGMIRADIDYLPDLVGMGRNTASKIAFCFAFVFPLGFLLYGLFRKGAFVYTLVSAGGIVGIVEIFYWMQLDQPFGFFFFGVSLGMASLGALLGRMVSK